MSEPFLSEIKIAAFNFAPRGWALCNGQFLPINQNQALFALLGTTYGGNGQTTFALPDVRGRVPIHFGGSQTLGERAGASAVTLTQQQLPQHIHFANASTANATLDAPGGAVLAEPSISAYGPPAALATMAPQTVGSVGGSQAHNNMQPYLVLNFIIALVGIFPSQN